MARSKERRRWLRERERSLAKARATVVPPTCDVCVVGSGAAGLVAALAAARAGASVVVLEAKEALGLSILRTGNGRCNLANVDLAPGHYNRPEFAEGVMGGEPTRHILDFFAELGLRTCEEEGRLYPLSLQAQSVRNLLVAAVEGAGVVAGALKTVGSLEPPGAAVGPSSPWTIRYASGEAPRTGTADAGRAGELRATGVVWCAGGGQVEALGALGLSLVELEPALCPVAVEPSPLDELDGRKARATLTLLREGVAVAEERGEVLFRAGALSGIAAFDLSRKARAGDEILCDLVPGLGQAILQAELLRLSDDALHPSPHGLDGFVDPAIARVILELAERGWPLPADTPVESACALAKRLPFRVTGLVADHPQLTRGGLDTRCVDPATLEVRGRADGSPCASGLFVAGEALDVDGPCGGYNLAFAWLSGERAGKAAAEARVER